MAKNNQQNRRRAINFCIGCSDLCSEAVHETIKSTETSSMTNSWQCLLPTTDSPTLERCLSPMTATCVLKKGMQFSHNPDPTHNCLSQTPFPWACEADHSQHLCVNQCWTERVSFLVPEHSPSKQFQQTSTNQSPFAHAPNDDKTQEETCIFPHEALKFDAKVQSWAFTVTSKTKPESESL